MIIDTNMLLDLLKNRVRVEEEMVTMSPCVEELSRLKVKEAKLALEFVKRKVKVVYSDLPADEAIIDYALRRRTSVATNDRELIKRLREKNIKVFRLRQNKYLEEV